jgi:EAL domain-containing protein (putative c-di-GMP-specific phosphodiesterase class I)
MKQAMPERVSSAEQLLFDYVERLRRNPGGRRAVVMHLSKLRPEKRAVQHLRIAANTFEAMVQQFDGQLFLLQQGDIVFVGRRENADAIDAAVTKVRYLFADDPLAGQGDDDTDNFATWFNIEDANGPFFIYIDELKREDERRRKRTGPLAAGPQPGERQPMDPAALNELISVLVRADLSNLLRRQSISTIIPGEPPKPLFREIYVSIADLREAVMPKRDIASDRWLFQYLTQTLDKRVLALLRRADDSGLTHSFSLNLNISTLLSPEFQAFDANLKAGARGSIVIEIEKVDVFADIGAYIFARDFARERGYRLCLDGITRLTLPLIDRAGLGLDLVKLFWSADMIQGADPEKQKEFLLALDRVGKGRLILARCDTEQSIAFGQAIGIKLFQGRVVEKMLHAATGPALTRNRLAAPQATAR